MRRVVCLGAGLIALAAGCSSDDDGSSVSDEEEVVEVISKMEAALARGDGEEACSYMTEEGQRFYVKLGEQLSKAKPETCEDAVAALVVSPSELPEDADLPAGEADAVTPDDVTVDEEAGTARAADEFRGAMRLERVDDQWRVSVPAFID